MIDVARGGSLCMLDAKQRMARADAINFTADVVRATNLTQRQLDAGVLMPQDSGRSLRICHPSPGMPMVAAALGGSVTAGLTFSVRQDPNGILWHARLGALLSRRLSGPVVMRNLGVPAMGPWYANQCTRARAPQHRFHLALVEYAINTEARSDLDEYEQLLKWTSAAMPTIAVHSARWACSTRHGKPGALKLPLREDADHAAIEAEMEAIAARHGVIVVSLRRAARVSAAFPADGSFMADCSHPSLLGHTQLAVLVDYALSRAVAARSRTSIFAKSIARQSCGLKAWPANLGAETCFLAGALAHVRSDNFTLGEYAPGKLALIPARGATSARLTYPYQGGPGKPIWLVLGIVVSWRSERVQGELFCVAGCSCERASFQHWHPQRTTVSEPIKLWLRPVRGASACTLHMISPPRITAVIPGGDSKRGAHWHTNQAVARADGMCIGKKGRQVACEPHTFDVG